MRAECWCGPDDCRGMRRSGSFGLCLSQSRGNRREASNLSSSLVEERFTIEDNAVALALLATDENLKALAEELDVKLVTRGNVIGITGEKGAVHQAQMVLADLLKVRRSVP